MAEASHRRGRRQSGSRPRSRQRQNGLRTGCHGLPPDVILASRPHGAPPKPGRCWAFAGSAGEVTIALAAPAAPATFVVEHVPRLLTSRASAAPKAFSVTGYEALDGKHAIDLGSFVFDLDGPPLQSFPATRPPHAPSVNYVKLAIESNHGFGPYTCLYRFAVH